MIITLLFGFTIPYPLLFFFFFFNDTATTEIYTLSLHDALPICRRPSLPVRLPRRPSRPAADQREIRSRARHHPADRKSTRLNSSHGYISYAVFCLKKKKTNQRLKSATVASTRPNNNTALCPIVT